MEEEALAASPLAWPAAAAAPRSASSARRNAMHCCSQSTQRSRQARVRLAPAPRATSSWKATASSGRHAATLRM